MKAAFTLCSNNYYAQALILGQSFLKHNPEFKFYIGLIDQKLSKIDYHQFDIEVIPVADIESDVYELALKFNIVELNTAVKPHYFLHFIEKLGADEIYYIDPDICIYQSFDELNKLLALNDILLTPHILKPIPLDGKKPFENDFLNYGLYNLGFLGLKTSDNTMAMLRWWKERTYTYGFHQLAKGLFVDQLWMNLVPILFTKVKILDHPGYNMGPWNLHERFLTEVAGSYYVNSDQVLFFYHFSNFDPSNPNKLHTVLDRYTMSGRPDLRRIYMEYIDQLKAFNYFELKEISCHYVEWRKAQLIKQSEEAYSNLSLKNKVLRKIKGSIPSTFRNYVLEVIKA